GSADAGLGGGRRRVDRRRQRLLPARRRHIRRHHLMAIPVIHAHGLGKRYALGSRRGHGTLRDALAGGAKRLARTLTRGRRCATPPEHLWALKDVSFSIDAGDVVGIIGRNGAGKSTLLKVLSQITDPSEGFVDVTGRVGSLLEVGTGFHEDLTG